MYLRGFMISGEKIKIRLVKEKDLDELFSRLQNAAYRFEGFISKIEPEHIMREKFQKHGFWQKDSGMMVIVNQKDHVLGCLVYQNCDVYHAIDIKYAIFEDEDRGKGYMKEALKLFSSYLFAIKEINRLQLAIPDYHRASIAVAQKCGYKFEGIARGAAFSKGRYIDLCIYAKLRDEAIENIKTDIAS